MFIVKKYGKRTVRKTFETYNDARSHVRRLVRKTKPWAYNVLDISAIRWRTPTLSDYGYSIHKV